jgi:hypothetical protein
MLSQFFGRDMRRQQTFGRGAPLGLGHRGRTKQENPDETHSKNQCIHTHALETRVCHSKNNKSMMNTFKVANPRRHIFPENGREN